MHIHTVTQAAVSAAATALTLTGSPTSVTTLPTLPVQPTTSELATTKPWFPWPTFQPRAIGRSNVASVTTEPEKKTGILFNWGVLRNLTLGNSTVSTWPILIAQVLDDTPSRELEDRDIPQPDTQYPGSPYPPPPAKPAPGDSTLLGRSTRPFNSTRQPFYGWIPVPNPNASVFEPTDRLSNTTHPHNATGTNPPTWKWVPLPVNMRPQPPLNWTEQVKKTKEWLSRHNSTGGSFFLPLNKTGGVEDTISDEEFASRLKEHLESIFRGKRPTHGNSTSTISPRHEEDVSDDEIVEEFMKNLRKIFDTIGLPAHGNSTSTISPRHEEDISDDDFASKLKKIIESILGPDGNLPTHGNSTSTISPRHKEDISDDDFASNKLKKIIESIFGPDGNLPTHGNSTSTIGPRHKEDISDDDIKDLKDIISQFDHLLETLDKVLGTGSNLPTHGNSTSTVGPGHEVDISDDDLEDLKDFLSQLDELTEALDKTFGYDGKLPTDGDSTNGIGPRDEEDITVGDDTAIDKWREALEKVLGRNGTLPTHGNSTSTVSPRQPAQDRPDTPREKVDKGIKKVIAETSRKHVQEAFDRYFRNGGKFHSKPGKRATESEPTGALSARQRVYAHVDNPFRGLTEFIKDIIEKASRKNHESEHAADGKPTGHVRRTARGSLGSA